MVEQWLNDFFWKDIPLGHFVTGVDVAFLDGPATPLWRSKAPCRALPADPPLEDAPPLDEAFYDMWHPLWYELIDTWHLTGTWLHPETSYCIDQLAFAEQRAYLYIGCHDRENPSKPRRYDASLSPITHDQGVIAFPLRTFRALEFHAAGYCPEAAMLLCASTAVVESAVHEALEMHQSFPGQPIPDPHTADLTIDVIIHWGPSGVSTTGQAHAQ